MQDLRLAIRSLTATPIVTCVAIISLALGIGANTAIFSLVDSLVLRTLPVVTPQQLVTLSTPRLVGMGTTAGWSYTIWDELRRRQLFADIAAWSNQRFNLAEHGETRFISGVYVSGSFFRLLGVPALVGRTIADIDDQRDGGPDGPVAMLSYGFWQRQFGGALNAIGQRITIEHVPFTIVGVTPPAFFGADVGRTFDVIVPIGTDSLVRGRQNRLDQKSFFWLTVIGRLRRGQTIDSAIAALQAVTPAIRQATIPENFPVQFRDRYLAGPEAFTLVSAARGTSSIRQRYERPLMTILAVVALVLLVACANIANLLLARATARRHDVAVRRALGGSAWHLARPFLAESAVLATVGGGLGLAFASWSSRVIIQQLSTRTNAVFLDVSLNPTILMFALFVTTITVVFFGTVPSLRATTIDPMDALKEHGRTVTGSSAFTAANGLVVVQVALSIMLVVAAGLLLRTFIALGSRPLGFEADHVLLANINSQRISFDASQRQVMFDRIRAEVRGLAGVTDAAFSIVTPVQGGGISDQIEISGGTTVAPTLLGGLANAYSNVVSPGWFATLDIPLLTGRAFSENDRATAQHVAIVNQALVRTFLNGADPIGRTLKHLRGVESQIIGVVADSVYGSLREAVPPTFYECIPQADLPPSALTNIALTIRTTDRPSTAAKSVAATIEHVNHELGITLVPLADQINASLVQERVTALLATFFGALALVLAALGLYGVTAYAVAQRRAELGIRMALGAAPGTIVRLVLSHVAALVATGLLVGAALSTWASRFVATLLYGLNPRDPTTLIASAVVLAGVAAIAASVPAWRASRIDPADVLREG